MTSCSISHHRQLECKLCGFKLVLPHPQAGLHNGAAPDVKFMEKWHDFKHMHDEGYSTNAKNGMGGSLTIISSEKIIEEGIWINSIIDGEYSSEGQHDPVDWDEEMKHPLFLYKLADHDWYANHCYKKSNPSTYVRQEWGPFKTKPELAKYIESIHTDEPHSRMDFKLYEEWNRRPCECEQCSKLYKSWEEMKKTDDKQDAIAWLNPECREKIRMELIEWRKNRIWKRRPDLAKYIVKDDED